FERHVEAKRLRGLQVKDKIELNRLLNRQFRRFGPLEDAVHVTRRAPHQVDRVDRIVHKPPAPHIRRIAVDGEQPVMEYQRHNYIAPLQDERVGITTRPPPGRLARESNVCSISASLATRATISSTP